MPVLLIIQRPCTYFEALWWQHHTLGLLLISRYWALVKIDIIMTSSKYQAILALNLLASGRKFEDEKKFSL